MTRWLDTSTWVAGAAALCLGGALWGVEQYLERQVELRNTLQTSVTAEQVAYRLEDFLDVRLDRVRGLGEAWSGGMNRGAFRQASGGLQERLGGFQALNWVNREGVIEWVEPEEENRGAVGRNLLEHPRAAPIYRGAVESGEVRLSPPLYLFQGGLGMVGYFPIGGPGAPGGCLNAVFRLQPLVEGCLRHGVMEHYALRIVDGTTEVYASGWEGVEFEGAESHRVQVGDRGWEVGLAPRAGSSVGQARGWVWAMSLVLVLGFGWSLRGSLMRREALRISEARQRALLDAMPDAVVNVDAKGRILDRRGRRVAEGRTLDDVVPEGSRARAQVALTEALAGGVPAPLEFVDEGDQAREVRLVRGGEGWALGVVRDVTARWRAEQARQRLAAVVQSAHELIVVLDAQGNVEYMNPSGLALLGFERLEDVVGESWQVWIAPGEWDRLQAAGAEFLAGRPWRGPLNLLHQQRKELVPTEWHGFALFEGDRSAPTRFVGMARDLSERLRLEEQLIQAQKLEALGRLASGIAHDFNNVLTVILGNAELALAQLPEDSPLREDLEEVVFASQRAKLLTRQILTVARHRRGSQGGCDLVQAVQGAERMLRRLVREDVALEVHAEGSAAVSMDEGRVEQVILNLAVNACDAMPEGGRLWMTVRDPQGAERGADAPEEWAVLEVRDTGIGMPEDVRRRAFEPFFTTKAAGKGTGLGLSTVHELVTRHGGWVSLEEGPEGGTSVVLGIPRGENATPKPLRPRPARLAGRGESVLLVEDEPAVRRTAARLLRAQGYRVLEASEGQEALQLAEGEPPALLVADAVTPGLGGAEFLETFRKQFPKTRILVTSGYADVWIPEGGQWLGKPYTSTELANKIASVLEFGPSSGGAGSSPGPLLRR